MTESLMPQRPTPYPPPNIDTPVMPCGGSKRRAGIGGRGWRSLLPAGLLVLAGCATSTDPVPIDRSITATGQNSRVEFVVLHYTNSNTARSLQLLSRGNVSSHYLITNDAQPRVYQLVDETRRAWHAGQSEWRGRTWLNASSIGIELVHEPFEPGTENQPTPAWRPWPQAQIDTLIPLLKDIVMRHDVAAENIVAHSDVAPQRKQDPGPAFPWRQLAEAGLGRWYDDVTLMRWQAELQGRPLPSVAWYQARLADVGYAVPQHGELDQATRAAVRAFQMHWHPERYDGAPDRDTAAKLLAVLQAEQWPEDPNPTR